MPKPVFPKYEGGRKLPGGSPENTGEQQGRIGTNRRRLARRRSCLVSYLLRLVFRLAVLAVFALRPELDVLRHDVDPGSGFACGVLPAILFEPSDHPHAPALMPQRRTAFGQLRPGFHLLVSLLLIRTGVGAVIAVHGNRTDGRSLFGVSYFRVLDQVPFHQFRLFIESFLCWSCRPAG